MTRNLGGFDDYVDFSCKSIRYLSVLLTGPPLPSHLSYGCHWLQTELDVMRCVLNNGLAAP